MLNMFMYSLGGVGGIFTTREYLSHARHGTIYHLKWIFIKFIIYFFLFRKEFNLKQSKPDCVGDLGKSIHNLALFCRSLTQSLFKLFH